MLECNDLNSLDKDQLVDLAKNLCDELKKKDDAFRKLVNLRLHLIERNQNLLNQYGKRNTIEITGIPEGIEQQNHEQEVIDMFREAIVVVNRQPIKPTDIQAVHRLGGGNTAIMKVVNRKCAKAALVNGINRYGEDTRIFINENLSPDIRFLNYAVRQGLKTKNIFKYKVRNGLSYIQKKTSSSTKFAMVCRTYKRKHLQVQSS